MTICTEIYPKTDYFKQHIFRINKYRNGLSIRIYRFVIFFNTKQAGK